MLRETAIASQGIKLHDRPQQLIPVGIQLAKAPPQQQYETWSKIMFGDTADGLLKDWNGYLLYASPPRELSELTPLLTQIRELPVSHPDFHILSSSLMISRAAAKCGKSNELIAKLEPLVKKPGDEAETLIGLAKFEAGDREGARTILKRVAEQLKASRPKTNGDGDVNVAAAFLAARFLAVDDSRDLAVDALTDLLYHVRRSKIQLLADLLWTPAGESRRFGRRRGPAGHAAEALCRRPGAVREPA